MTEKIQLAALTNAITDVIMNVKEEEIARLGLKKGFHNSKANISYGDFLNLVKNKEKIIIPGGSPANVVRGAARLGIRTALFGTIGNDFYGKEYKKNIEKFGIKDLMSIEEGQSGVCYTFITEDREKTSIASIGVAKEFSFDLTRLKEAEIFHTSGYELMTNPQRTMETIDYAKKLDAKISFDLADPNAIKENKKDIEEILKKTDILFATEEEAMELVNEFDELRNVAPLTILKKGKNGSEVMQGKDKYLIPVYLSDVVGTNGAGDAYSAGFLTEYLNRSNIKDCGYFASYYAAQVCSIKEPYLPAE